MLLMPGVVHFDPRLPRVGLGNTHPLFLRVSTGRSHNKGGLQLFGGFANSSQPKAGAAGKFTRVTGGPPYPA